MPDLQQLQRQIADLQRQVQGLSRADTQVNLDTQLAGLFEVVSAAPTGIPKRAYDQIKIYTNSTTYRLYWYDWVNHAWHYVTATA